MRNETMRKQEVFERQQPSVLCIWTVCRWFFLCGWVTFVSLCVYTTLIIHFPTMKHQHRAISQCNRFVSSRRKSPGGPITEPSGAWRWFRERGRPKTRCDGKLLIHLLIKGHFLSAIRGWRVAYLGFDFLFYLASFLPNALLHQSSSHAEKHRLAAEVGAQGSITS